MIGKINVPKFENFPEIDVFCLISCPESSFVPNPKDYSKPILTPFELEVNVQCNYAAHVYTGITRDYSYTVFVFTLFVLLL